MGKEFILYRDSLLVVLLLVANVSWAQPAVEIKIDNSKQLHGIDGFGVNINTRSWVNSDLKPALDLLRDSMGLTLWRVVAETEKGWEEENDNDDPFTFNWEYYDKLYETDPFQKVWRVVNYLNEKGATGNNVIINLMGQIPSWMGKGIVSTDKEDEYIEMLVSFIYYAKNTRHLDFGLFSPMNEPDITREGPTVGAVQYAALVRKMTDRFNALHLEVEVIGPDAASMKKGLQEYLPEMFKDSIIMADLYRVALHSYAGNTDDASKFLESSAYPGMGLWITEYNAWRDGLDDGQVGVYDYAFASQCAFYLMDLIKSGASACLVWEGYDSYYDHHYPSLFSYWGILGYDAAKKTYYPRKHVAAISQFSKFVQPGSVMVSCSDTPNDLPMVAFYENQSNTTSLIGINRSNGHRSLTILLESNEPPENIKLIYTNESQNLAESGNVIVTARSIQVEVPANCIFTLTGILNSKAPGVGNIVKPEPKGWYAGDIHVHRNCGGDSLLAETELAGMMEPNDLDVISVLADMGNGEVKDSRADLLKVTGTDAPESTADRIIHWDAEWHWDATYTQFGKQALGGHLVLLGLTEARQIWDASPYKILEWAKKHNGIGGFCHFEYLNDRVQDDLNCCIPIEYPVEAALGTMDFISEDVYGSASPNNGNYNSEAAINAYYKLLNCGFKLGFAAGTDYPCNNNEPLGTLLTYVNIKDQKLTYPKWIQGIKMGRTVVSRNGHDEFIDLKINNSYQPGDELKFEDKATVQIEVTWTTKQWLSGTIELVCNGKVIASQSGSTHPGSPLTFNTSSEIAKSSWICARRMDESGHQSHTGPVYIRINDKPVRSSADDAQYFITWIDNLIAKTSSGGEWNKYFTSDLKTVQQRYRNARNVYQRIYREAKFN